MCARTSQPEFPGGARLPERHGFFASGSSLPAPPSMTFLLQSSLSPRQPGQACVCWSPAPRGPRLAPSAD